MGFSIKKWKAGSADKWEPTGMRSSATSNGIGSDWGGVGDWGKSTGDWYKKWNGDAGRKSDHAAYQKSVDEQRQATEGVLGKMQTGDDDYLASAEMSQMRYGAARDDASKTYSKDLDDLRDQMDKQSKDASATYTNTVQPGLKNIMEKARTEADGAMSLKDAGDPNNSVQQGVRNMYENQAQGVGKQGLADAGVLASLGAQASAGQMGGAPMTGGQMAAIQGQNQAQSGQAYAKAQQQMQSLREQGIESGFRESDRQYQRGEGAKDRYSGSLKDIQGADGIYQDQMGKFRDEKGKNRKDYFDNKQGRNADELNQSKGIQGLRQGLKQGQASRELGAINQYYGGQQGGISSQLSGKGMQGFFSGGSGIVGSMMGKMGMGGGGQQQQQQQGGGQQQGYAGADYGGGGYGGGGGGYGGGGGGYDYGNGADYPARPE